MHSSLIEKLKDQTNIFFSLHWNKGLLGDAPQWSEVHTDFSNLFQAMINKAFMLL